MAKNCGNCRFGTPAGHRRYHCDLIGEDMPAGKKCCGWRSRRTPALMWLAAAGLAAAAIVGLLLIAGCTFVVYGSIGQEKHIKRVVVENYDTRPSMPPAVMDWILDWMAAQPIEGPAPRGAGDIRGVGEFKIPWDPNYWGDTVIYLSAPVCGDSEAALSVGDSELPVGSGYIPSGERETLFARAGDYCEICGAYLYQHGCFIGEMAHLRGERPGSARHDPAMPDDERNTADNLLLLCPNCHTQIDKCPDDWPVETLERYKRQIKIK